MKHFFTSDCHLGHANIIKYCNRPFNSLEDMDFTIMRNWNSRVKDEDTIFVLGDFCFKNSPGGKIGEGTQNKADFYSKQLNGNKIFIQGNHDKNNSCKTIIQHIKIGYGGHEINLVHKPQHIDVDCKINFVGHIHQNWKYKCVWYRGKLIDCINVGVDVNDFMPKTFEELYHTYVKWTKTSSEVKQNCCTYDNLVEVNCAR